MYIKNPNDIVDTLVSDYCAAFGDILISVIMHGSALSHEFIPGKSEVSLIIVLKDTSISTIRKCLPVQKNWAKRGVTTPYFVTVPFINSSLELYPIKFLNIQNDYKVLYGDDVLKDCQINKKCLKLQCERELKDIGTYLKNEYLKTLGNKRKLKSVLKCTMEQLIPLFKAVLILYDRKIPYSKSEVIAAVEDLFGFGSSALSDIFFKERNIVDFQLFFDEFVKTVDLMIQYINDITGLVVHNRGLTNI